MKKTYLIILLATILQACDAPDQNISRQITEQFDNKSLSSIELGKIDNFSWDRVCAIGPYSTNDTIEKEIGFKWDGEFKSSISESDGINLLIFIKENTVIAFAEHPRNKGDFIKMKPRCLPKANALLYKLKDKDDWIQLVTKNQLPIHEQFH